MKRFLVLTMCLGMLVGSAFAQKRITGEVKSSTDQFGIPGATVMEKGTSNGVTTDIDGKYSITVSDGATLVFSFVGYQTVEIEVGSRAVVDLMMDEDVTELSEVVVTALGVSREESSLGYAVQEVSGDQVNMVGESNVVNSLTGKVAGVQVIGSSGANIGGSTKVRLRGITGLGEQEPLWVVDGTPISNNSFSPGGRTHYSGGRDYGNLAADINPNDIASITVLKGPSAAALYGQRGANGVILVTTKKGSSRNGIGVTINSNTTVDKVYVLPEYQDEYGGGYTQSFSTFTYDANNHPAEWAALDGQLMPNYAADESWGPALDGTNVIHWDAFFPGHDDYLTTRPWSPNPNNVRDFFDTGLTLNNNVAFSGGTEKTSARVSIGNLQQNGVLPNSRLEKNNLSLNLSTELSERLTLTGQVMYTNTKGQGRPALGYGTGPVSSFNQWFQRQLDIDRLRDYKTPSGIHRFWNIRGSDIAAGNIPSQPLYWDNPFWSLYEDVPLDERDRLLGNLGLTLKITDDLRLTGTVRHDGYTQRIEERTASGGLNLPSYYMSVRQGLEDNYEFLAEYNKNISDLSIAATFGGNIRKNTWYTSSNGTVGGLSVGGFYDIDASIDRPTVNSYRAEKIVRSFYGSASFGFRDFVYLDVTGRQDWSSTLPVNNNGYFYPSVSTSFVFSELFDSNVLSFGKLRASVAQIGSDIGVFGVLPTYNVGQPYGSFATLGVPGQLPNADLVPQTSNNVEAGLNLNFFQNRVELDVAVYQNVVRDQILSLTVPGSSGYSTALVNAGAIEAKGIEVAINATPIQGDKFNWDINFNFARNRSTVLELAEGLDNRVLQTAISDGWGGLRLNARVGEEWGQLTGGGFQEFQAYDTEGNEIDHPSNGMPIVRTNGTYGYEANKDLGSILPDFTGGLRNTFSYGNFDASFFIDYQIGGQFFSITKMFNAYSGLGIETVGNNDLGNPLRDPVRTADGTIVGATTSDDIAGNSGGVRVDGVDANGDAITYYTTGISYYGALFGRNENWLYDASFVKLREVRIGYNLPSSLINRVGLSSANIGFVGRNLWLIYTGVEGIDPSEIAEGAGGFSVAEGGVLPGVRSLGVNLRLGL